MNQKKDENNKNWIVCCHIGCGEISKDPYRVKQYLQLMKQVCRASSLILKKNIKPILKKKHNNNNNNNNNYPCIEACESCISILEDNPFTNAGIGSNLTRDLQVECDSCICCSIQTKNITKNKPKTNTNTKKRKRKSEKQENNEENDEEKNSKSKKYFGSVGGVPGVRNPILLSSHLMKDQMFNSEYFNFGLVRPVMLCSIGAWKYAKSLNSLIVAQNENEFKHYLVTQPSLIKHQQYLSIINQPPKLNIKNNDNNKNYDNDNGDNEDYSESESDSEGDSEYSDDYNEEIEEKYDTVGAVCIDQCGDISSGVSSGGLSLKYSGRIGEAAIYGSGCYSDDDFGVSCTGTGELIMKTMLAKQVIDLIKKKSKNHNNNNNNNHNNHNNNNDDGDDEDNNDDDEDWSNSNEVITSSIKEVLSSETYQSNPINSHGGLIVVKKEKVFKKKMDLDENEENEKNEENEENEGNEENENKFSINYKICFGHTTPAMGIAFYSSKMKSVKAFISRKENFSKYLMTKKNDPLVGSFNI